MLYSVARHYFSEHEATGQNAEMGNSIFTSARLHPLQIRALLSRSADGSAAICACSNQGAIQTEEDTVYAVLHVTK
jgi:hypothetical protein